MRRRLGLLVVAAALVFAGCDAVEVVDPVDETAALRENFFDWVMASKNNRAEALCMTDYFFDNYSEARIRDLLYYADADNETHVRMVMDASEACS